MKKIKYFFTVIKIFMLNQLNDRTNIILDCFHMVSRCFIVFLIYGYVFKVKGGYINGVDYKTTIWSMFIYFCIMILNIRSIDRLIMEDVVSGNVEMFMNKPTSYLTINALKVIGKGIFSFLVISVFGSLLMAFTVGVPNVNLKIFIPTFILTLLLGQILCLLVYAIIGVLSFYIQNVRPVHWIVDKFVMVLGGSYLPVSMFPGFMKVAAFVSPFGAINFATSTVYDSWNQEFLTRLILQVIWIGIFIVILNLLYRKSKEKAMINGG